MKSIRQKTISRLSDNISLTGMDGVDVQSIAELFKYAIREGLMHIDN
jgi:hypothetical protein